MDIERIIETYGRWHTPAPLSVHLRAEYLGEEVRIAYEVNASSLDDNPLFATITVAALRKSNPKRYEVVYEYNAMKGELVKYVPGEWEDYIIAYGEFTKLTNIRKNQWISRYLSSKAFNKIAKNDLDYLMGE